MSLAPVQTAEVAVPLSRALRDGSAVEHETAEGTPFLRELLAGTVSDERYAAYLRRLLPVYEQLESLVRSEPPDSVVARFDDGALDRVGALRRDLDHWAPAGPRDVDSAAVRAYRRRLRYAAAHPPLLLAHHYTRYLGDLAGGQAVGRLLARHHDLRAGGAGFYAFPRVPEPKLYRDAYRARLDALPLAEAERGGLVEEVREAFRLTVRLLHEV